MIFAIPDGMTASFVFFHSVRISHALSEHPSPKGEGFTDPLSGDSKRFGTGVIDGKIQGHVVTVEV